MLVLYKPLLLEDIKKNTISKIEKFVTQKKGTFTEVENLGKKLLAYPIRKFEEGHYIEYKLTISPEHIAELKKDMQIMDNILRFIIINK